MTLCGRRRSSHNCLTYMCNVWLSACHFPPRDAVLKGKGGFYEIVFFHNKTWFFFVVFYWFHRIDGTCPVIFWEFLDLLLSFLYFWRQKHDKEFWSLCTLTHMNLTRGVTFLDNFWIPPLDPALVEIKNEKKITDLSSTHPKTYELTLCMTVFFLIPPSGSGPR